MPLATVIRNSIAIAKKVANNGKLLVTVQHHAWIADGAVHGEPVYDDPVARLALVEMKQRLIRLEGQDFIQKAVVTFLEPIAANGAANRFEPIDLRDKIVLPNGYTGPIKDVQGLENQFSDSPYMVEVILG